jgi:hypothetical protein
MARLTNKKPAVEDARKLTGPEKAAVILLSLGEDHTRLWQGLDEDEIKEISQAMASLGTHYRADQMLQGASGAIAHPEWVVRAPNVMLTIMGIKARDLALDIAGTRCEVEKIMQAGPRKVAEIRVLVKWGGQVLSAEQKATLEQAALTCPVFLSLDPALKKTLSWE